MKIRKTMTTMAAGVIMLAMTMGQAAPEGCDNNPTPVTGARADNYRQQAVQDQMQELQKTPTDIRFSLERYNLVRRAYWVNGMREKALSLPCKVDKPIGYVILLLDNGVVFGSFIVDGKLSSLKSYLTPISEDYAVAVSGEAYSQVCTKWLADVDGCYGDNDQGIFFFTPDGKYIEWNAKYFYSDIPFNVKDPVLKIEQTLKGIEK